jgi:hypothetical protein
MCNLQLYLAHAGRVGINTEAGVAHQGHQQLCLNRSVFKSTRLCCESPSNLGWCVGLGQAADELVQSHTMMATDRDYHTVCVTI